MFNFGLKYILAVKKDEKEIVGQEEILINFLCQNLNHFLRIKSIVVLENKEVLPRAFIVYQYQVINDEEEIIYNLLSPDFDYLKKIILEKEIPQK